MENTNQPELIKLTDLIDALRNQLIEQDAERPPDFQPLFKIKNATVEANVTAETVVGGHGEMNFYLVKIGAEGSQASGTSFKMAITLEPFSENDERLVAGEEP